MCDFKELYRVSQSNISYVFRCLLTTVLLYFALNFYFVDEYLKAIRKETCPLSCSSIIQLFVNLSELLKNVINTGARDRKIYTVK